MKTYENTFTFLKWEVLTKRKSDLPEEDMETGRVEHLGCIIPVQIRAM